MKHCWICRQNILDGYESRDHVIPKKYRKPGAGRGPWFWAHQNCNHSRGELSFEFIENLHKELDIKYPNGWGQGHILPLLGNAKRGGKTTKEKLEERIFRSTEKYRERKLIHPEQTRASSANRKGRFQIFHEGKWITVDYRQNLNVHLVET